MKRTASALLAAALLMLPLGAQAQYVGRELGPQETLRFMPLAETSYARGTLIPMGPYSADLVTSGYPTVPGLSIYCVDFINDVSIGDQWDVNVTNLGPTAADGPGGTMGNTRLGDVAGSLTRYRQSAFLTSLFEAYNTYIGQTYIDPSTGLAKTFNDRLDVWTGIHSAIWSIMDGSFPASYLNGEQTALLDAMAQPFRQLAQNTDLSGFDFSQYSVLSDVATATDKTAGRQEFVVRTTVTPEPETFVLLLSGMLVLFGVARRRRRREITC